MTIKEVRRGEYFTLKEVEYPTDRQVYVRGEYDRSERAYWCYKWHDVNDGRFFKGTRKAYTDFVF